MLNASLEKLPKPILLCFLFLFYTTVFLACAKKAEQPAEEGKNKQSDPQAYAIARQLLDACGGKAGWDSTRYITWKNFGKRRQLWDKFTGNIRVENSMMIVLMNLETQEGRAWKFGEEISDPNTLQRALDWAYEAWQYDSHELLLPFLLTDKHVILNIAGTAEVNGYPVDILEVTFQGDRPNPNAKYHLFVDRESHLLVQWDYYMDKEDVHPRFSIPWRNYKKYGEILLSDDRGKKKHTDVAVFDELPASVLTSPEPVNFSQQMVEHQDIN